MLKTYCHQCSFHELADVYTTTKANYGKIEGELLLEINVRGGIPVANGHRFTEAKKK